MFFYYQMSAIKRWAPCISTDLPQEKSKKKVRQITELPPHHRDLPLHILQIFYPLTDEV